jgi:hypothetical protein
MLRSQENRHQQFGMAGRRTTDAIISASAADPWRPQTGALAMIAVLLVTAAGAAALLSQSSPSNNQIDPLVGKPLERLSQPADLHAKVRSELPDRSWAEPTEAAISERLIRIPLVGKNGNVLRVTCGVTLCEIAGTLIGGGLPPKEYDPNLPINRAVADLQDKSLNDDLAKLGLKNESGTFVSAEGKPSREVFFLYYSRQDAK